MSTSFIVTGHFANGHTRLAGVQWPGGPTKTRNPMGGTFLPAFQQRAEQYGRTFKSELEEAPKRADGLPTFDYIDIAYQIQPAYSGGVVKTGHLWLAVTPKALDKLIKAYGNSIDFDDYNVRYRYMKDNLGAMRVNCSGVVDLTKFRNANAFWSKVRLYANYVYQPVFAVGH